MARRKPTHYTWPGKESPKERQVNDKTLILTAGKGISISPSGDQGLISFLSLPLEIYSWPGTLSSGQRLTP